MDIGLNLTHESYIWIDQCEHQTSFNNYHSKYRLPTDYHHLDKFFRWDQIEFVAQYSLYNPLKLIETSFSYDSQGF